MNINYYLLLFEMGCCQLKDLRNENVNLKYDNKNLKNKDIQHNKFINDMFENLKQNGVKVNENEDKVSQLSDYIKNTSQKQRINILEKFQHDKNKNVENPSAHGTVFSEATMTIKILCGNEIINLGVNSYNTVTDVLSRLHHEHKEKTNNFKKKKLYYKNQELENFETLEDHNIGEGSQLELKYPEEKK